jgi:hypothetical protein
MLISEAVLSFIRLNGTMFDPVCDTMLGFAWQ